jgi:hypothetical protein
MKSIYANLIEQIVLISSEIYLFTFPLNFVYFFKQIGAREGGEAFVCFAMLLSSEQAEAATYHDLFRRIATGCGTVKLTPCTRTERIGEKEKIIQ